MNGWHPRDTAPFNEPVQAYIVPKTTAKPFYAIGFRLFVQNDEPEIFGPHRRTQGCWLADGKIWPKGYVRFWAPLEPAPKENQL